MSTLAAPASFTATGGLNIALGDIAVDRVGARSFTADGKLRATTTAPTSITWVHGLPFNDDGELFVVDSGAATGTYRVNGILLADSGAVVCVAESGAVGPFVEAQGLKFDAGGAILVEGLFFSLNFLSGILDPRVTFSRASNATQFDSAGNLVWAPSQLLSATNDLTVSSRWSLSGVVPATVTSGQTAPDGTPTAFLIDVSYAGDSRISNDIGGGKTPAGGSAVYSAWMRTVPGDPDGTWAIRLRRRDGTSFDTTVSISSEWTRVSVTLELGSGASSTVVWIGNNGFGGSNTRALIWKPMLSPGTKVWEYIENTDTTNTVAIYGPRFDYDPATLEPQGLLIEKQRTNGVRNSSLVDGVAGTPGTAPTYWTISSIAGITVTTDYGVEDGIPYVDITYSGTNTTGANAFPLITTDSASAIAAVNGQTWASSAFIRKIGGSDPESDWGINVAARDAAQALISGQSSVTNMSSGSNLASSRVAVVFTFSDAAVAFAQCRIRRNTLAAGASMDITLRVAYPQLELANFATSVIPTFGTAASRAGDVADLITAPPWAQSGTSYYVEAKRAGFAVSGSGDASGGLFFFGINLDTQVSAPFGFGTSSQQRLDLVNAGVLQAALSTTVIPAGTITKMAVRLAPDDARGAYNGIMTSQDTSVTMPASIPVGVLTLGRREGVGHQMDGWLRKLQIYTQALPDSTLVSMTS